MREWQVMDHGSRRLVLALAASTLLHAALMQAVEGSAARRARSTDTALLAARLLPPQITVSTRTTDTEREMPAPHTLQREIHEAQPPQRAVVATPVPLVTPHPRQVETPSLTLHGNAAATQVSDPTYYGARSLDVYPQAITALILAAPFNTGAAGKVRATVLIDESGAVNEVRSVEASAVEIESAARDLLLRARFTPASKDGRVVKAQLLLSLDYGASGVYSGR